MPDNAPVDIDALDNGIDWQKPPPDTAKRKKPQGYWLHDFFVHYYQGSERFNYAPHVMPDIWCISTLEAKDDAATWQC